MRLVLPLSAVFLGATIAVAAAGPCGPGKKRHCVVEDQTIDLSTVSDITKHIVASEPAPPPRPAIADGAAAAPNGPSLGMTALPRGVVSATHPGPLAAPTINYKWSLE